MPKVSVLMPTYNTAEEHLRAALDSVLAQTFTDFELILLDDCSGDPKVKEVIRSYADSRIRFVENEKNLGISAARNRLIDLAQGEYLAVMDHDDISLPERLEKQAAFLDSRPEVGVVGACVKKIPKNKIVFFPPDNEDIEELLMFECAVWHSASMIRKSALEETGIRYEQEYSPSEDHRLWCRLIGNTKFANLPEILLHYRAHPGNTSKLREEIMSVRWGLLAAQARREHPEVWHRAQHRAITETHYKLFGAILIMSVIQRRNRKKYLLFGFLPVLKSKQRTSLRKALEK